MSKRKYTTDWIIARIVKYESGQEAYESLVKSNGIGKNTVERWVKKYREQVVIKLAKGNGNARYSKEFNLKYVEAVIHGEGSINDIAANNLFSCG